MPTVVIGDNTGNDYSGTTDAFLWSAMSGWNNGGATTIGVHAYSADNRKNGLLKFSGLSNITSGVTVSSATLYMNYNYNAGGTAKTFSFYRLLRNWTEGTQSNGDHTADTPDSCCWDDYGDGNAWQTAGGTGANDSSSTVTGYYSITDTTGWKNFSTSQLAADVEDFINGDLSNYGYLIRRTDAGNDGNDGTFISSEGADGSRPYLSVTYEAASSGSGNTYYYQQQLM